APLKIVATVNGEDITREELAKECLRHYGQQVLEALQHKYLIMLECQKNGISVTTEEVNAEIERMAKRFGLPVDQWLKMLKQERGIKPAQYASDIIWPMLALKKLAGSRLQTTQEELVAEFESLYGPAVKARLIACSDLQKAQKVRAQAAANPAEFGNLAKTYSEDPTSASLKGMIQPIRKHVGDKRIEQAAFSLKDGEVSEVIPVAGQFVILQREELIPAQNIPFEKVKPQLEKLVEDRKLREVAGETFQGLKEAAKVQNVLNDPELSRQMPGVAALINGNQVTIRELAERCIERYGEEVLEGTINRRLLEQACRKKNVTVTEAEIDQEIARMAATMLKPKDDGSPDVANWLKLVTEQQGVTVEVYRRDVVWPSLALKKLVEHTVQVTDEDLKKGYEANYGPRVRCRAIILDNLRRAQEVWAKARDNPTEEYFGRLAEQYSCEANNRIMKGEVPPIQMHGGQPVLEKEAFNLKPGELSGIIQVGADKYVVLLCLGRTTPQPVDFAKVRDLIYEDIREKKLRLAMANHFQEIQEAATIDNYLAGVTRAPRSKAERVSPQGPAEPDDVRAARRAGTAIAPTPR
ncbi:MAG: peptidylprolyl isomerase, partial [Thermoguttaceae bacterium]|nr:peptidylprolyl isomerase [Thermoguttaceae bacterium]